MGFPTFNDLKRAQRLDARRTQDVTSKRVVAAYGSEHLIIRETESCGGDRIVPNAAGATFGPNAQAIVATPGGSNQRAVLSRPPSGSGSVLAPRTVAKGLGVAKQGVAAYYAFYRDDANHLTVKTLTAEGAVASTVLDNITIDGTIDEQAPGVVMIAGDANGLPDNSFTIAAQLLKIWTCNIATGALVEILDLNGNNVELASRGVYWDEANSLIMIMTHDDSFFEIGKLYKATTDGVTSALVKSHSASDGDFDADAVVWWSDRACYFNDAFGPPIQGLVQFPFDGSAVTERLPPSGDVPLDTTYTSDEADVIPAGDRYFVDLDSTATYIEAGRLPTPTGDAATVNLPPSRFYPGQALRLYAQLIGTSPVELCMWPVVSSAGGTDYSIFRYDVTNLGAATAANALTAVEDASGSPVQPFAVYPAAE